jgi:hypothetical protein
MLKWDPVGRVSYRAQRREAILDEFERSGLKGAAFARLTGLQDQTFASWIQRRRHERGDYPKEDADGPRMARIELIITDL